jgi:hypothetical protein
MENTTIVETVVNVSQEIGRRNRSMLRINSHFKISEIS